MWLQGIPHRSFINHKGENSDNTQQVAVNPFYIISQTRRQIGKLTDLQGCGAMENSYHHLVSILKKVKIEFKHEKRGG